MKTSNSKKLRLQSLLSKLTLVIGMLLLVFTISMESEPGAIPLLLVLAGAAWYFVIRAQQRSQSRME